VNGHGIRAGSIEWEWVSLVTGVPSTEPVETEARPTVETLLLNAKAVSLRANPLRACELFEQILFRVDPSQATGVIRESAVPYALALLEVGRFDDAESWLRDTLDIAVVAASPRLELQTAAILAKLLADRDHPQEATRVLDGALHRQMQVDLTDNAFTDLLLASARSAICAAEDDLDTAYFIAAQGFGPEGRSRHYIANQLALPELLAPGVRLGHESELSRLVEAACRTWMARGLTVSALFEHALAVSMATDDPEELFRSSISRALATSRLTRAAFARADYGAWLRRQRRAGEAREVLQAAREFFVKAGLRRPASWVEMELRAAGDVSAAAHVEAILAPLTPQQQQIVRLAAAGLRNEQIAKQMYLSTHTVRSHLYRVFPKLGVNSRQQLRELLHGSSSAADGDTQARTG
jgi:DNA-binding CsgD family transcriptional regulator